MVEIERVQRPFWMHQVIEYLLGIGLISAAIQMPQPAVPAVLGLAIILNAAITKGAAGAFRWAGKRAHRRLDVVVMLLLLAAPVLLVLILVKVLSKPKLPPALPKADQPSTSEDGL